MSADMRHERSLYHCCKPLRQDQRRAVRYRDCVFEMCGPGSVFRDDGPAIAQFPYLVAAKGQHRLDRQRHSLLQLESSARVAPVWNMRFFPHLAANAMTTPLSKNAQPAGGGIFLDRIPDI